MDGLCLDNFYLNLVSIIKKIKWSENINGGIYYLFSAARQGGNLMLTNIQQRKTWEAQFDNSYIKPTFGGNKVCYGLRCFQKFAKGSYPKSLSPRHNALKNMINP